MYTRKKEQQVLNVHMLSKQNRVQTVHVKTHFNPCKSAEFIHPSHKHELYACNQQILTS